MVQIKLPSDFILHEPPYIPKEELELYRRINAAPVAHYSRKPQPREPEAQSPEGPPHDLPPNAGN